MTEFTYIQDDLILIRSIWDGTKQYSKVYACQFSGKLAGLMTTWCKNRKRKKKDRILKIGSN